MASQQPFQDRNYQPSAYQRPQLYNNQSVDEFKTPFDDPDDNASPYSQHKTYNVDSTAMSTGQHRRGPSYPLQKPAFPSGKVSVDFSEQSHPAYPPATLPADDSEKISFWRRILPDSLACRLYILLVLIETTIDLAIEGDLYARVHLAKSKSGPARTMPAYLGVFALAHVFQFVMAVDAVYYRNTLQFVCLTIFNAVFLMYSIIQTRDVKNSLDELASTPGVPDIPINVLTIVLPLVISVAEVGYIGLGWKIYHEFGWSVYKSLGADRRIKKMYANYQIYECLVKFDVFFWAAFSVQFIWLVLQSGDWEYYVTCAALPLSLVLLVEGHLAARHENKWMMATFMSGCIAAMIYFVYKLVKVLVLRNDDQFKFVWKTLTSFSVVAIILLFVTFVYSILVLQNFGRGLKEALSRKEAEQPTIMHPHRRAPSTTLNRMSID